MALLFGEDTMALFRITGDTVELVPGQDFSHEKELQSTLEKNLESILGVTFLETEYPIPNGRIDTIGLDETKTPVVIEYKKRQDYGAIVQGLFYVDWIRQNRRTFEMLVREKLGKDVKVDWSLSPRLIIIAQGFDIKEISAINQIRANVELKRYSYYGDMLSIEDIALPKRYSSEVVSSDAEDGERGSVEPPSMENLLSRAGNKVRDTFLEVRETLLSMGDDIEEKPKSSMVAYYCGGKGLAWFELKRKTLTIHLRKRRYMDEKGRLKVGWGNYPLVSLGEDELDVNYLVDLLHQAYV